MRRFLALLSAVAFVGAAAVVGAPSALAAALPVGQCTTASNVVLAVDFSHWGGPIVRACGSTPTTGYQLLNEGSFSTVGTQHDGPAFICRISTSAFHGGTPYPRPNEPGESCGPTPPASAYWSYWHADPGQNTWSYSSLGAMSYHPEPGSVDLWIFGGTNIAGNSGSGVPRYSPNTVRARNAPVSGDEGPPVVRHSASRRAVPSAHPASHAAPGTQAHRSVQTTSAAAPQTPVRTTATHPHASASSRTTTTVAPSRVQRTSSTATATSATPSTSKSTTSGPAVINASPTAAKVKSSGSALPLLLALGVALVLATGAGWTVLRRRRLE